jgi:mono/diheme cytochrome c family protein
VVGHFIRIKAGDRVRARFLTTLVSTLVALTFSSCNQLSRTPAAAAADADAIPAARGPSLLNTLGLQLEASKFGQVGGSAPIEKAAGQEPMPPVASPRGFGRGMFSWFFGPSGTGEAQAQPFVLTGADLYRINCQSCHGPDGAGAPPEINSLVDPVRGTSIDLLVRRMQQESHPVDVPFLKDIASGALSDLRERLRQMPSFSYLTDDQVDALVGYLQRMCGVPEAPASGQQVPLSAAAVGGMVVNGTCHICHDATGPGRHAMMMQGSVPSLASMPEEEAFGDFVAKVRDGVAPRMMMMSTGPSRMPTLAYLTKEELAAALLYLRTNPPES